MNTIVNPLTIVICVPCLPVREIGVISSPQLFTRSRYHGGTTTCMVHGASPSHAEDPPNRKTLGRSVLVVFRLRFRWLQMASASVWILSDSKLLDLS